MAVVHDEQAKESAGEFGRFVQAPLEGEEDDWPFLSDFFSDTLLLGEGEYYPKDVKGKRAFHRSDLARPISKWYRLAISCCSSIAPIYAFLSPLAARRWRFIDFLTRAHFVALDCPVALCLAREAGRFSPSGAPVGSAGIGAKRGISCREDCSSRWLCSPRL
jgi:hypothetical protein